MYSAVLVVSSCTNGSESATRCVRQADAQVCARRDGGAIVFEASGLQPGSMLEIASTSAGTIRAPIGSDGRPDGQVGAVGEAFPARVKVVAVTDEGDVVRETLVVE